MPSASVTGRAPPEFTALTKAAHSHVTHKEEIGSSAVDRDVPVAPHPWSDLDFKFHPGSRMELLIALYIIHIMQPSKMI
jgi:hypothetical protein